MRLCRNIITSESNATYYTHYRSLGQTLMRNTAFFIVVYRTSPSSLSTPLRRLTSV
jgi:hypothetical protein